MPDHLHMLLSIPPKHALSQVFGYIKGKSAIHMALVYVERKRNFVFQHFFALVFFVNTVSRDEEAIRAYIRNQEKEYQRLEQMNSALTNATFTRLQTQGSPQRPLLPLQLSHLKPPACRGILPTARPRKASNWTPRQSLLKSEIRRHDGLAAARRAAFRIFCKKSAGTKYAAARSRRGGPPGI